MDANSSSANISRFQKFRLLLWKNYLWHRYYWWWAIIEILARSVIPVYMGYSAIRGDIYKPVMKPATLTLPLTRTDLLKTILREMEYFSYTPSTPFTDLLMNNVVKTVVSLDISKNLELVKSPDEKQMELDTLNRTITNAESPFGIVFLGITSNDSNVPNKLVYKLRHKHLWDSKILYQMWQYFPGPYQPPPKWKHYFNADYKFWVSGISAVQLLINEEFVRMRKNSSTWSAPEPFFQPFPYPKYESNRESRELALHHLIFVYIAFDTILFVPFLASVITEKRNGSKELMKIYGIEEWMIWLCWFIKAFVITYLSVTLMTVLFYVPLRGPRSEVINFVSFSVVWMTFLLYEAASISLILFFGAIFNHAMIASVTFLFVTYFIYIAMLIVNMLDLEAIVLNVFPMRNLLYGFSLVRLSEMHGFRANLASTSELRSANSSYKTHIFFYLANIIDTIIYAILSILINKGVFGRLKSKLVNLKGLFSRSDDDADHKDSLQKVYNSRTDRIEKKTDHSVWKIHESQVQTQTGASSNLEHEPLLQIEELHANYKGTHVLKGVNVEFHENEINVILGHTGAGKNAFLSVLTESIPIIRGSVHFRGNDVTSNLDVLRDEIGISFKVEGLLHHLSVNQHLIFYGMLKGLSKNDATEQGENLLMQMEMQEETKSPTKKLSLISKKKLGIVLSLIGQHEPMVGLDVHSKIEVWNLLMDMRSHHTIILTSNYEKEAEIFADRITIMENGIVTAHGTRDFIKQNIGNDYELLISGKTINSSNISDIVHYNVNAIVERETDNAIVYKVPLSESPKFHDLFSSLENDVQSLGISNINVTFNTIQDELIKNGTLTGPQSTVSSHTAEILREDPSGATKGFGLRLRQMGILFKRRIVILKRDYVNVLLRIVIPTVIVLLLVQIIEIFEFNPFPVMSLSPNAYVFSKFMLHNKTSNQNLVKLYSNYLQSKGVSLYPSKKDNIIESLIDFGEENIISYRRELVAGFEMDGMKTLGILFNLFGKYTLPIAIAVYSNVLLKSTSNDGSSEIITYHHPLPVVHDSVSICPQKEKTVRVFTYFLLLFFTFGYLSNEVILYLFEFTNKEIVDGLMHIEIMSGVPKWIYWFTTFVFDFLFFILVVAVRVALFKLFDNFINFFVFSAEFGVFALLMLIYGSTALFCSYIFSHVYKPVNRSYGHLFLFNMACNVIGILLIFMRNILLFENIINRSSPIVSLVLCLPFVNYLYTMQNYFIAWYINNKCFFLCSPVVLDACLAMFPPQPYLVFGSDTNEYTLLWELICLITVLICSAVLFILVNVGIADLFRKMFVKSTSQQHLEDDNVVEERVDIQQAKEDESRYLQIPLMVDGLGKNKLKWFRSTPFVEDVSFMTEHGTCFGILGSHEAGKTIAFDMMSAKIRPTKGNVSVEGFRMIGDKNQYFSMVTYCPQTSPLLDKFTGREMLMFIASLKGIDDDVGSVVDELISSTGLDNIQHEKCESYSNGSKRILSTVLSLIGNPKVIFLDEPADDIDSESRRHVYDICEQVKLAGKILVLGSRSPKKCELLCDRITMLMNGVMHCIGNPQDLRNQFSLGYFIMIKVDPDPSSAKDVYFLENNIINVFGFDSCRLIADYKGLIHYLITDHSLPISGIFQRMEDIKRDNSVIEEYMVSTSTLENIFDSLESSKELFRSASFH